MSTIKNFILFLAITIFFTLNSACTVPFIDTAKPVSQINGESFADFLDIPYPTNMSLDKNKSFVYNRRGHQAGVVVTTGRINLDEIGAYYDEHLPNYGWEPVAEAQADRLVSTWKKGKRILTIIAYPATFSITSNSVLELWVGAPHTKNDLGKRIIYKGETQSNSYSTTPQGLSIKENKNSKNSDDISESNL